MVAHEQTATHTCTPTDLRTALAALQLQLQQLVQDAAEAKSHHAADVAAAQQHAADVAAAQLDALSTAQQQLTKQLNALSSAQQHLTQQVADLTAGMQHLQQALDVHSTRTEGLERALCTKADRTDVVGLVTTLTRSTTVEMAPWSASVEPSAERGKNVALHDAEAAVDVAVKQGGQQQSTAATDGREQQSTEPAPSSLHRTVSQLVAASSAQAAQVAALQGLLAMLDKQLAGGCGRAARTLCHNTSQPRRTPPRWTS